MRKSIALVLIFSGVVLLPGCEARSGPRKPVPGVDVLMMEPEEANCQCAGAVRYKLVNQGGHRWMKKGIRYRRLLTQDSSTVVPQPLTIEVGPNATVPLQCSILPDSNADCIESVVFEIDGIQYPDTLQDLNRDMVVDIVQASTDPLNSDMNPTGDCVQACLGDSGQPCQSFDATGSSDVQLGKEIALLLGNVTPRDTIGIDKIVELTSSKTNECGRTDVAFENYVGYNFGNACEIRGTLPGGSGRADVIVPSSLLLEYSKKGAGNFEFRFYKSGAAPEVRFSDGGLQQAYGGHIKQMNYHDGQYILQHENNSCFAIRVK